MFSSCRPRAKLSKPGGGPGLFCDFLLLGTVSHGSRGSPSLICCFPVLERPWQSTGGTPCPILIYHPGSLLLYSTRPCPVWHAPGKDLSHRFKESVVVIINCFYFFLPIIWWRYRQRVSRLRLSEPLTCCRQLIQQFRRLIPPGFLIGCGAGPCDLYRPGGSRLW